MKYKGNWTTMNNLKHIAILLFIATLAFSCGARKGLKLTPTAPTAESSYWASQIDQEYLSIKGKIIVSGTSGNSQVTANIRMKQDSIIWASLGLMGMFEGVRVMITTDSVMVLNRLEGTYLSRPLSYLKEFLGMDIELSDIQNIMIGNAAFDSASYTWYQADSSAYLKGYKDHVTNTITVGEDSRTQSSKFTSSQRPEKANINYIVYALFEGLNAPSEIEANVWINGVETQVKIMYSSIKTEAVSNFAFRVPDTYKHI